MYPVLLYLGAKPILSWGIFLIIGGWAAYFSFNSDLKRCGFSSVVAQWQINLFFIGAVVMGAIGAHLAQMITVSGIHDLNFMSGYVLYGAPIGVMLYGTVVWFLSPWKKQLSRLHLFDMGSLAVIWLLVFVRIGCLLAGCCYGTPAHGWPGYLMNEARWDVQNGHFPERLRGISLHYTPLYESLGLFGIVMLIYAMRRYEKNKNISFPMGVLACVVWMSYGFIRFPLEWIRWDDRGSLSYGLSPSQWIALVTIGMGWVEIRRLYRQRLQSLKS
jgi:phosphatidylglycerol:prolipoprotein diacylglycerol transferase